MGRLDRYSEEHRKLEQEKIKRMMDELLILVEEKKSKMKPEWVISSPVVNKIYYYLDVLVKRLLILK